MTEMRRGYDSEAAIDRCDYCDHPILLDQPRVICGTGSSLLATYHSDCWQRMITPHRNPVAGGSHYIFKD